MTQSGLLVKGLDKKTSRSKSLRRSPLTSHPPLRLPKDSRGFRSSSNTTSRSWQCSEWLSCYPILNLYVTSKVSEEWLEINKDTVTEREGEVLKRRPYTTDVTPLFTKIIEKDINLEWNTRDNRLPREGSVSSTNTRSPGLRQGTVVVGPKRRPRLEFLGGQRRIVLPTGISRPKLSDSPNGCTGPSCPSEVLLPIDWKDGGCRVKSYYFRVRTLFKSRKILGP